MDTHSRVTHTDWIVVFLYLATMIYLIGYIVRQLWRKYRWEMPCFMGVMSLLAWIANASNPEHWSRDGLHFVWLAASFAVIIPSAELANRSERADS